MDALSYFGVIDQSLRRFKRASHALSFLCMKTTVPFKRFKRHSARKCVKLAKQMGWDPNKDWRDYPSRWQERPQYKDKK